MRTGTEQRSSGMSYCRPGFFITFRIIGEAVRTLPDEVRALAPDIPWSKIIGMRNVLVHGYFEIDADIVWEAVTRDIPALKPALEGLLKTLEEK